MNKGRCPLLLLHALEAEVQLAEVQDESQEEPPWAEEEVVEPLLQLKPRRSLVLVLPREARRTRKPRLLRPRLSAFQRRMFLLSSPVSAA